MTKLKKLKEIMKEEREELMRLCNINNKIDTCLSLLSNMIITIIFNQKKRIER